MTVFSAEFRAWLSQLPGKNSFGTRGDGVYFALNSGEYVFYVDPIEGGWWRMTEVIRGGKPRWEFDAASLEIAEIHLSVKYGNSVRRRLGLLPFRVPDRVGEESPFVERTLVEWSGPPAPSDPPTRMTVLSSGGRPRARFWYPGEDYVPVIGHFSMITPASWYVDKTLPEVLAAFQHPTGAPLFQLLPPRPTTP